MSRGHDEDDVSGKDGGDESDGHGDFADPLFFFDNAPKVGSLDTPGRVTPDKVFGAKFFNRKLDMPDGEEVEFWGFEDRLHEVEEDVIRPSSPLRATEGDIVHVTVEPSKRQHTVHLHGIESDTFNDGVGHTSFEVTGSYTYQFRAGAPFRSLDDVEPQTQGAGTYFYHCHVNTTLHFHMGMYGVLIIDPLVMDPIEGEGVAFNGGPTYDAAQERGWGAGDVDPIWHELGHAAGMKGGDAGLNDFNPVYFDITGKFQPMKNGKVDPDGLIEDPSITAMGDVGGLPILVRYGNTSYTRQRITFHGIDDGLLAVKIIASDGRGFDNRAPNFASPIQMQGSLETTTAERYDLLITPLVKGTSIVTIEYLHWITGRPLGVARTTVTGV